MKADVILEQPDPITFKNLQADLHEDTNRFQRQTELFKEWLTCETYLPKDVDDQLVQSFVRQCKCDLEKAKKKFINYLSLRMKCESYYFNWNLEPYFEQILLHRQIIVCPKLTPEGYRIGMLRLPSDINQFDFMKLFHYALILLDIVLHADTCAAYMCVYDFKNLTAQHLGKVNLKALATGIDLIYNVAPFRIKAMHFINVPHIPETLISLVKKIVPEKIITRTNVHKDVESLRKSISGDVLPKEYGGTTLTGDEMTENWKNFFAGKRKWESKLANLKPRGPIPKRRHELYSFEDFEMGGSFRKLSID